MRLVRAPRLAERVPYAYAAVATGCTRLVFTAGACPLDQAGNVADRTVRGQAEQAAANLLVALEASGARVEDVVNTTVYVASQDRADLQVAWDVVRSRFGEHDAPGTLLGVSVLGWPGQLVEVEAIAALA